MSFTDSVIQDFQRESDLKVKQGQEKSNPVTGDTQVETAPAPASETEAGDQQAKFSFSQIIKEQMGLDLSDEEIINRVKGTQQAGSETKPAEPVAGPEPYSEAEIISTLEKKGRNRDYYNSVKELSKMDDLSVVKLHWKAELTKANPSLRAEDIDELIEQKYSISDEEGIYSDHEKQFGKLSLTNEAARIREERALDLEDVEYELQQQKKLEHQAGLRARKVDAFIATMPKTLTVTIGKLGNHDLGQMEFPLQEDSINRVAEILKNPAIFSQKFTNPTTGEVDYGKLSRLLLQAELGEQIIKSTANKYYSSGIERVESKQLNNPNLSTVGSNASADEARMKQEAVDFNAKQVQTMIGGGAR